MRAVQHPVLKLMSQPPAPQLNATVVSRGSIQHVYSSLILSSSSSPLPFNSSTPPLIPSFVFPPLLFFCSYPSNSPLILYCLLVLFLLLLLLLILSLCVLFLFLFSLSLLPPSWMHNNDTMAVHCVSLI
jgi:hypothetical protein